MALYLEIESGSFELFDGSQLLGSGDGAYRVNAAAVEACWSVEACEAVGLYRPEAADAVPDGKIVTGTTVQRVGGVVKFVHTLADAPVYVPETPELYALATMTIEDGNVSAIVPSTKLAGGFRLDTGIYWVFFAEPQPATDYQVLCFNHASRVYVSERYEDFFVITAESDGAPTDPGNICIQITRVV